MEAAFDFPRGLDDSENVSLSSARWLHGQKVEQELHQPSNALEHGGILLGEDGRSSKIAILDDRHMLTVAGSRAGKGVSLVVPNLLFWPHSALVIDPKGELATVTASRRSAGGSGWAEPLGGWSVVLDPFKRVTGPAVTSRGGFNPIYDLDPDTDEGLERATQIADALILQQEGAGAHWTMGARGFIRGLILHIAATEPPSSRHLIRLREIICINFADDDGVSFLKTMAMAGGTAGRAASSMLGKPDNERASILSTCEIQTDFLEGKAMESVLTDHDFNLADLKAEEPLTVYLCLPANRLATHGRWLRLMVGLALEAMERHPAIDRRVLFLLDEFAALGHMSVIEKAAGQVAGFGVKLWPIIQDITQLQRDYRTSWETFMGNAGVLTFFGNTDLTTLEHISKRLGQVTVIQTQSNPSKTTSTNTTETSSSSEGLSQPSERERMQFYSSAEGIKSGEVGLTSSSVDKSNSTSTTTSKSETVTQSSQSVQIAMMLPDEVRLNFSRKSGNILVLMPEHHPIALKRVKYFDDPLFDGKFDPTPEHPLEEGPKQWFSER